MKSVLTTAMLWAYLLEIASGAVNLVGEDKTFLFSSTPQTGNLEIYVELTGSLPALFGATTYVTLSPFDSGVTFTGFEKTTTHPYIIPSSSPAGQLIDGHIIDVTDFAFANFTLQDNAGVLKINFSIAGGTTGKFDVLISNDPLKTFLTDYQASTIHYDNIKSGSIVIVPEPSSIVLMLSAALALAVLLRSTRLKIRGRRTS